MHIRESRDDDLAAVQAIYAREVMSGTASFEIVPPTLAEMTLRRGRLIDAGYPYLVAEADQGVSGYAYAGPYRPRPAYAHTVENSVYVVESARRRGVATALLGALIERCEARGFRQMVAVIGDSAHVASIRLHERAGFRMVGTLENVGWKFGRWLDSVLMQRPLGPGAGAPGDPSRAA